MKKYINRFLSLLVVFVIILSSLPAVDIIIYAEDNGVKIVEEIKEYYCTEKDEYNYLESMTLKSLGVSDDSIKNKLKSEELSFEVGDSYQDSTSKEYAKVIMGLVAVSFDLIDYNGKDYEI